MRLNGWIRDLTRGRCSLWAPTRFLLAVALVSSLLLSTAPQPVSASASTWVLDTSTRTEADIQQEWMRRKPTFTGSPYAVLPSAQAPYATGTLESGFVRDGLNMLNFARYLAGLPDDVVLSAALNREAQYGAVLIASTGVLTHFPDKPSDMSQSFFDVGAASARTSNLGSGHLTLATFQSRCLSDNSSAGNLKYVGHRRWLLNPSMKLTGMGYADGRSTTYSLDRSRSESVSYSTIAWPSAGAFPVEMFCEYTPWSITLNPELFDIDQQSTEHSVTLSRVADGRTWHFDSSHVDTTGHYLSTDFSWMGVPNVFVFRPDPRTVSYQRGDVFDVTLSVHVKGRSTPETVSYRTHFVSMEGGTWSGSALAEGASRIHVGQTLSRVFDYDGALDQVYFDASEGAWLEISSPGVRAGLYDSEGMLLETFSGVAPELWMSPSDGRYYFVLEDSPIGHDPKRYELSVIEHTRSPSRVEGRDRFETAVEASKLAFPTGADTVVIATARSWPDALGGTALAGVLDAPILLTGTHSVPDVVADELTRLGASRAVIVGGVSAVGTAVESELVRRLGTRNVERIWGPSRYDTADLVAARVIDELGSAYSGTVLVATGVRFPDALAAAPLAASQGWPLVLVDPSCDSVELSGDVKEALILGGTDVVSIAVQDSLESRLGATQVERISGVTRYATAAAIARWATDRTELGWRGVAIATGRSFPDALAGGVLQGKRESVMLLTQPEKLSVDSATVLAQSGICASEVTLVGGPNAVGHEVRNAVIEILR